MIVKWTSLEKPEKKKKIFENLKRKTIENELRTVTAGTI